MSLSTNEERTVSQNLLLHRYAPTAEGLSYLLLDACEAGAKEILLSSRDTYLNDYFSDQKPIIASEVHNGNAKDIIVSRVPKGNSLDSIFFVVNSHDLSHRTLFLPEYASLGAYVSKKLGAESEKDYALAINIAASHLDYCHVDLGKSVSILAQTFAHKLESLTGAKKHLASLLHERLMIHTSFFAVYRETLASFKEYSSSDKVVSYDDYSRIMYLVTAVDNRLSQTTSLAEEKVSRLDVSKIEETAFANAIRHDLCSLTSLAEGLRNDVESYFAKMVLNANTNSLVDDTDMVNDDVLDVLTAKDESWSAEMVIGPSRPSLEQNQAHNKSTFYETTLYPTIQNTFGTSSSRNSINLVSHFACKTLKPKSIDELLSENYTVPIGPTRP